MDKNFTRSLMNSSELLEPHRLLTRPRIARTRPEELSEEFSTEACSTLPSPLCDQARQTSHFQPPKTTVKPSNNPEVLNMAILKEKTYSSHLVESYLFVFESLWSSLITREYKKELKVMRMTNYLSVLLGYSNWIS